MAVTTGPPVSTESPQHERSTEYSSVLVRGDVVFPLIFHSIQDEIPSASQPLITRLYQIWLVLAGTLVVNMVACICILASGSSNGGSDLGSSIGYVVRPPGYIARTLLRRVSTKLSDPYYAFVFLAMVPVGDCPQFPIESSLIRLLVLSIMAT